MTDLVAYWEGLPDALRGLLRLGYTGTDHLLSIVGECLRRKDESLTSMAADGLATAMGENPLDGGLAANLLQVGPVRAILPEELANVMVVLARHWQCPTDLTAFESLRAERDFPAVKQYVLDRLAEGENLFWTQQGLAAGLVDNDPDYCLGLLDGDFSPALSPLIATARAMVTGDWGFNGAVLGRGFVPLRHGLALVHRGERDQGLSVLFQALRATPWNSSLALVLGDLAQGVDQETAPLDGPVGVLLYTHNKADELDGTLASLAGSDLSGASVFVLDNGSTDHTPQVMARWSTRFEDLLGQGRFHGVNLPVNVGAPAARNWLMAMGELDDFPYACFLDDDVELPPDWLTRLGAAAARFPEAGVWGCKVVDHAAPALIQSADSHLYINRTGKGDPFGLTGLHARSLDQGLFDFMRSCASVTGCCHLFRTSVLRETGPFSIHLSPSQYDDMEHDLRRALDGRFAVYQGHLRVLHKKRSGAASRTLPDQRAGAVANKHKMLALHLEHDVASAVAAEGALLERDLTARYKLLSESLSS